MPNRDVISSSIDIAAPPAAVWAVVSDLRRMGEWSPQCRRMVIRGKDKTVRVGTRTVNLNRRGPLFWPTRSKVTEFVPERRLAFRIAENGTTWVYELEPTASGTRVTESRLAPHGVSAVSNLLTQKVLGGTESFEDELLEGIDQTLQRIKTEAEQGVRP